MPLTPKIVFTFITYWAKLLSADWLRQRAFFLNQEGSFGNQEGMITKTQKEVRTTGLTFSNNGQRREKKMSDLKATKYQSLTKSAIILPFMRLGQFYENFENTREINP